MKDLRFYLKMTVIQQTSHISRRKEKITFAPQRTDRGFPEDH